MSQNKLKILFVIPTISKGGAERVLANLLSLWDQDSFQLTVALYTKEVGYEIPQGVSFAVLNAPGARSYFEKVIVSFRRVYRLRDTIKAVRPDIIISFMNRVNITTVVAHSLARVTSRIVLTEHNVPSVQLKGMIGKFTKKAMQLYYRKADMVIAVSEGIRQELMKDIKIAPNKVRAIHNPHNSHMIEEMAKEYNDHPWFKDGLLPVVAVGSLTTQKGHEYLLRAFVGILNKYANARLLILGEGDLRDHLLRLAESLGIHQFVSLAGFQPNPFKFTSRAVVYVLPSLWEGCPMVLQEAMICGCPIVATDCKTGPNELIRHGESGLLVPICDANALSEAICFLIDNPKIRSKFSQVVKADSRLFDVSKVVSEYETMARNIFE